MWLLSVSHSVVSDSATHGGHSPPGSSVHGISQAGILEWVASPFSRGSSSLPDPGIEPRSPALRADSLPFWLPGKPQGDDTMIY